MLQTEIDKQHVLQKFVDQNIIYCVSGLVYSLSAKMESLYDEFPELFEGAPSLIDADFECEKCGIDWNVIDMEWSEDIQHNAFHISSECGNPACRAYCITDKWEVTQYEEILEHWIVSDWLADKLAEHGEAVCKDFYGLTVWGRTTSGQGIALDGVIESIYDELHKGDISND